MSQTAAQIDHERTLRQGLGRLSQRQQEVSTRSLALRWFAGWLSVLLLTLLADAIWGVPPYGRAAALIGLLLAWPAGVAVGVFKRWRALPRLLHDAQQIEQQHALRTNPLVGALSLPASQAAGDPFAVALTRRAYQRAADSFGAADANVVVQPQRGRRSAGYLWAVIVAWLVVGILHPALLGRGLLRVVDPFGPCPPFSLTGFEISWMPEEPTAGQNIVVQAHLTGRLSDDAAFVQLDEQGREVRRWPMRQIEAAGFAYSLIGLKEPIAFRVETGDARSWPYAIEPTPRDTAESEPQSKGADKSKQASEEKSPADPSLRDYLAVHHPELLEQLQQLGPAAQQIRDQAAALQASDPPLDAQQQAQALAALDQNVAAFTGQASEIAQQLRQAAQQSPKPWDERLNELAEQLQGLSLCQAGACPNPGRGGDGLPKPGTGQGTGSGVGGGGLMVGPNGYWIASVQQRALADLFALGVLTDLPTEHSRFANAGPVEQDAQSLLDGTPPTYGGSYRESADRIDQSALELQALMRQVPAGYRELVSQYYRRLADDSSGEQ